MLLPRLVMGSACVTSVLGERRKEGTVAVVVWCVRGLILAMNEVWLEV